MVEVKPVSQSTRAIGQVVLKRLITAEQVLEHLCCADAVGNMHGIRSLTPAGELNGLNREAD
jgi:hypothetical protein